MGPLGTPGDEHEAQGPAGKGPAELSQPQQDNFWGEGTGKVTIQSPSQPLATL